MVVLSASVCTRSGKALVSRQFVEMNRLRIEGLLAAFPKLVGHAKQHTFVETDSVRYVYQPLENSMYLLLITTKASNIVEDLSTLRLLAKVVPDICGGFLEQSINENAFELIFAFDEVLTAGGYREEASLNSIRTNLIMDSHEEKLHNAMQEKKQQDAIEKMRQRSEQIQKDKLSQMRQNFVQGGGGGGSMGGMQGFGGGGDAPKAGIFDIQGQQMEQQQQSIYSNNIYASQAPTPAAPSAPKVLAKSGMKLGGMGGGAAKKDKLLAAMAKEDGLKGLAAKSNAFDLAAPKVAVAAVPSTPLTVVIDEKVTALLNREGGVESCEVKGKLELTANTDAGATAIINIDKSQLNGNFNFGTNPKIDKKAYESTGVLTQKNNKAFPVGRSVGIYRWTYNGEDAAPITINCWPEEDSGTINVSMEVEMQRPDLKLYDVNVLIPLGTTAPPEITEMEGIYKHDPANGMMCWHFDQLDGSSSMEFTVPGADPEAFFPIQVGFRSETLLGGVNVASITCSQNQTSIPHQLSKSFAPDNYQCA